VIKREIETEIEMMIEIFDLKLQILLAILE
jgi:hypothetical protein